MIDASTGPSEANSASPEPAIDTSARSTSRLAIAALPEPATVRSSDPALPEAVMSPDPAIVRSSDSASSRAIFTVPDPATVTFAAPLIRSASISPDPARTSVVRLGVVTRTVAIPDPFQSLSRLIASVSSLNEKRSAATASASPETSMSRSSPSVTTTRSGPARTSSVGGSPLMSSSASGTPSSPPIDMFIPSQPESKAAPASIPSGASAFTIFWIIAVRSYVAAVRIADIIQRVSFIKVMIGSSLHSAQGRAGQATRARAGLLAIGGTHNLGTAAPGNIGRHAAIGR